MKRNKLKKVPQIIIVTLLSGLPLCYAESALATSSFGLPIQTQLSSQQSVKSNQLLNQPKKYLNSRLQSSLTPSVNDLNTLKSTLADYSTQLDTLISQQPTNDSPELQTAINTLKTGISTLKTDVDTLESDLNAYNKAKTALTNALKTQTLTNKDAEDKRKIFSSSQTSHEATKQQLEVQKAAVAQSQTQLANANASVLQAQELLTNSTEALTQQNAITAQALQTLNERQINASTASATLAQAEQTLANAQAQNAQAERDLLSKALRQAQAQENLDLAAAKLQTKQLEVNTARSTYNEVIANYIHLLNVYSNVYDQYLSAQTTQQETQITLSQAQNTLAQAQQDYDTLLIPDPTWTPLTYEQERTHIVATTTLVPRTITTLTGGLTADVFNRQGYNNAPPLPTATERPFYTTTVPNINFQWGGGNVLGSGRSEDVIVRFTGNISFPTSGNYQFYSPADDGTILFIDGVQVTNDWRDKGGGGSTSAPIYFEGGSSHTITLYYYENGGGAAVWLYYYTSQTGYQLVPAAYLGTVATTETTYVEETTYTYETYYTTEVIPGQVHPLINDPALLPALQEAQANQQAALATFNEADQNWKTAQANQQTAAQDSLAGYYQVIDTATSLNALSSDLDVEQNAFNQTQATYNEANADLQQSQQVLSESQQSLATAELTSNEATQALIRSNSQLQVAQVAYNTESQKNQETRTSNEQAKTSLEAASSTQSQAQATLETQTSLLSSATSNEAQANSDADLAAANSATADATSNEASITSQQTQTTTDKAAASFQSSLEVAQATILTIPDLIKEATNIFNTPQGSSEVPTNLDASNLQEIDLSQVDPTELSPEQAVLLVEAALETFETATEGSPEYEQALDALYLAAEQDDIVVDEALANIPGVGQAAVAIANVLNAVSNIGADISPKARKKAQGLVVTTLIVGQIAQAAALASASSGGSSNKTNRINRKTGK
jgi:chemotaxis protein histidine kinase CheA